MCLRPLPPYIISCFFVYWQTKFHAGARQIRPQSFRPAPRTSLWCWCQGGRSCSILRSTFPVESTSCEKLDFARARREKDVVVTCNTQGTAVVCIHSLSICVPSGCLLLQGGGGRRQRARPNKQDTEYKGRGTWSFMHTRFDNHK